MKRQRFSRRALCGALCAASWLLAGSSALAAVHAGDELQVTVYNHPDLSRKVTVDAADTLSLPLAGTVDVHGLETSQIALRIERALEPYVVKPAVDVQVTAQSASLFVAGGPGGVLKYEPGETLVAALAELPASDGGIAAQNAGFTSLQRTRVDLTRVGVVRDGTSIGTFDATALSAAGSTGPALQPGDTISLVNKPTAVRVLGAVQRPGFAYLSTDESLSDALEQAGGVSADGATARIALTRSGTTQYLAMGDPQFRQPAQAGDVISVPTAPRVAVAGLVDKPGVVELKTNFTLLNAIYQAGGPTKQADITHVAVMHDGTKTVYDVGALGSGDMSQNPTLQDGDFVFVPQGHKTDVLPIFQALLPILYLFPR